MSRLSNSARKVTPTAPAYSTGDKGNDANTSKEHNRRYTQSFEAELEAAARRRALIRHAGQIPGSPGTPEAGVQTGTINGVLAQLGLASLPLRPKP